MTDILDHPYLHVDRIPDGIDLVARVRALNAEGIPWMWGISAGPQDTFSLDRVRLNFGVHNDIGAVKWADSTTSLVPAIGTNTAWRTYHPAGIHDTAVPPRAEVPVEIVFDVLAEFLRTRTLPKTIEWTQAADISSIPRGAE
ncbi:Imm1 family immunity protein [Actinokineospora sp.]|uniref:Imm1 family immunity protein n=1 Tax=Actinokineospora sp. TaxID=1872133 RepID=UPI004037B571